MSLSTHLCLKQSQKSNWLYISIIFIKILSRGECGNIRKQRGPNHRYKQILTPSTFRCYEQHWRVLHQFFWLMKMFPISFSQILIAHHVHKSNPSKDSLCLPSSRWFSALPGEVLALSPMSITSWILEVMTFRVVFQQQKPGQAAGDCWRKVVSGHALNTRLCQMGMTSATSTVTIPAWAGQDDTRGSLLNFQPPGSVQAPTPKAAHTYGSWHLLEVNSDSSCGSIIFLMLWMQVHVIEAFKMLPFI